MKRICFGSLYVLMYQARGQGVKNEPLFDAILKSFRLNGTYRESLPGHLKNGHDKVPTDIIDAVRSCNPDDALKLFEINVMPLIKDSLRKPLLLAILRILDEDQGVDRNLPISWNSKYTKQAVMTAQSIDLTYLLVSLIRFAVLEIDNQACADGIREIPDEYVDSFIKVEKDIEIDEPGFVLKWPSGEIQTVVKREYISDEEIRNDVDALRKMLSKYKKPDEIPVPFQIAETEMTYVEALYEAYASVEDVPKYTRRDVDRSKRYKKDFTYQRKCFYATEAIRKSLQNALLPIEYKEFDEMQQEIKEGVYPKYIAPYDNGFERLTSVTSQAALVPVTRSQIAMLPGWIGAAEKVGMCHMLVNNKDMKWVDEDE